LVEVALAFAAKSKRPEAALYVQILIQKIVHIGGSDEVAFALYHFYHHSNDGPYGAAVLETMLQISTPRECATLLRSILRHLIAEVEYEYSTSQALDMFCRERLLPYLKAVCGPVVETSQDVRESFVQLAVLSSSSTGVGTKSDRVLCHCVAMLLAACEADEDESSDEEDEIGVFSKRPLVLRRHLNEVASYWSETVFVQHTNMCLQRHVTHFLLSAICMLGSNDKEEASSRLAQTLVNGVSVRLASSLNEIRKDGMRVAELLAKRMANPLRFEELDHEREIDGVIMTNLSTELPSEKEKEVIRTKGRGVNKKRASRRRAAKPVDPDAEYASDQDNDSSQTDDDTDHDSDFQGDEDSVWDDDEPLIPYNLDDDEEDLREAPTPLYLRQCLDMLRTPDTEDAAWSRHESALGAMSPLIRSNPADLPYLTMPLCGAILHLENKFDLPDFHVHTEAGLVSLAAMQPVLAGEYLIKNFFSGHVGLSTRLSVLHTLESAAYELCGAKALEEGRRKLASER
jgi:telomere length regulation protein